MKAPFFSVPALLLLPGSLIFSACSSESPGGGTGGTGTGGNVGLTGGGPGVGGAEIGGSPSGGTESTGGEPGGDGGAPAGGSDGIGGGEPTGGAPGGTGGGASSICPSGLEGMRPDLSGMVEDAASPAAAIAGVEGGEQTFLEGPVWVNGALYVSQIRQYGSQPPAQILKLEGGTLVPFILDSGTNGLAVDAQGRLVAASHKLRGITYFNVASPTTAPTDTIDMGPFNSPNDLTVRADGNVYFTDPTYQCSTCNVSPNAYRIAPNGMVTALDPPHNNPNGIALAPDGNTLYLAGDSAAIQKYAVMADGSLGPAAPFVATSGVDGMTVDCAGNVYATVHSQGKVDVYTPGGELIGSVSAGASTTNVAFGGPNRTTLFITRYDRTLRKVELDIPGLPY